MSMPPAFVIEEAHIAAGGSPCQKSQRGAAVFEPRVADDPVRPERALIASGYNGPPPPMACDGSAACRRDCGKICEHAEARAIRGAMLDAPISYNLKGYEMVHVKVVSGVVVPGGPPSCWQCSRTILDVRLDAMWLYEDDNWRSRGVWRRYTAKEFHEATLLNAGLYPYQISPEIE